MAETPLVVPVEVAPAAPAPEVAPAPVVAPEVTPAVTPEVTPEAALEIKPLLSPDADAATPVEQQTPVLTPELEFVAPTFEEFTVPEGVAVDKELMGEFTEELTEFAVNTKAPAEEVQKFGQQLVDRHVREVQAAVERNTQALAQEWESKKAAWYEDFKKDPEIGGNRQDTTISQVKQVLKTHIASPEILTGFYKALEDTGGDYHPGILKGLWAIANSKQFRAPEPVLATKPVAEKNKYEKRYGIN